MKRFIFIIPLLFLMFALTGCGGSWFGDGRMAAWKDVRDDEEATKQELLITKRAEIKQKKASKTQQNPTLKITTFDAQGKVLSITEMDLQPTIAAITGGVKNDDNYGVEIITTDMPQGEFAENMRATGEMATKVGNTPVALAGTVGYFIKEVVQDQTGTTITAEEVILNDSLNRTESHATGEGNSSRVDNTRDYSDDHTINTTDPGGQ